MNVRLLVAVVCGVFALPLPDVDDARSECEVPQTDYDWIRCHTNLRVIRMTYCLVAKLCK
jgi:hypothetical protein